MNIQAKVALDKESNPSSYCPIRRCLWRTGQFYCTGCETYTDRPGTCCGQERRSLTGDYCPRHKHLDPKGAA